MDENAAHRAELAALTLAARVRLRRAEQEHDAAPWWRRAATSRALTRAREEWGDALADEQAAVPPPEGDRFGLRRERGDVPGPR